MKIAAIVIGVLIIVLIVVLLSRSKTMPTDQTQTTPEAPSLPTQAAATGFEVKDIVVGTGAEAKAGDVVTVQYTGTLTNGTKFDSSYDRPGQPFRFALGAGMVIKGWDMGVAGMKEGGKRHLVIPADLAYGPASPSSLIPANSTLVFDVELLKVEHTQ